MFVWLASYLPSGNTMLRSLLHRMFGIAVPSVYEEGIATGEHDRGDLVPRFERPADLDAAGFAKGARRCPKLLVTKTYQMPNGGEDPAIVVVRDGRAAMASFERYTINYGDMPSELEEIVIDAPPLLNWSEWIAAWTARPALMLLLRYEKVTEHPESAAALLATFPKRPVTGHYGLTFADFKAVNPTLFGIGRDGHCIAEVERRCPNFFSTLHRTQMERFGYGAGEHREPALPLAAAFGDAGAAIRRLRRATPGW